MSFTVIQARLRIDYGQMLMSRVVSVRHQLRQSLANQAIDSDIYAILMKKSHEMDELLRKYLKDEEQKYEMLGGRFHTRDVQL